MWIHDLAELVNKIDTSSGTKYNYDSLLAGSFYWSWDGNNYPMVGLVNNVGLLHICQGAWVLIYFAHLSWLLAAETGNTRYPLMLEHIYGL